MSAWKAVADGVEELNPGYFALVVTTVHRADASRAWDSAGEATAMQQDRRWGCRVVEETASA